ncbi:hypothetical protein ONS95_008453 [Cadophora gregata]|uniref:uncharacterized protein n=1 Tax=Cadophora gregata TaxID=51156 RepID=UPI0026DD6A95|nr:uncharacterized protein ONS95_008453 [Cadophora gregata]KAK0100506.1 hypothetical protein ONS96_007780 [Cadophora gregata f. sp. sojae]KAK0126874.1 hypothetical protein ONS95_008453 [Cadophora gregata]
MNASISPGPDTRFAPNYLIPCGVLAVVALGLCVTRIYTRSRPVLHLALDDYLIVVAEIFSLTGYCLACAAASHGWGHLSFYISAADQKIAYKCIFALELIWVLTIPLIRISVACSLMRFGNSRLWMGTLYALIVIQSLISTGWVILQFFNCKPLRSFWEPVSNFKCWPRDVTLIYGWFTACVFILMDFILATMPLKLIRTLNRPLREKILIGCLMAMGLIATIIAGIKTKTFKNVYLGDPLSTTVDSSMWAKLEELVGIIAACMPCLKARVEKFLRRAGILSDQQDSMPMPSFVDPNHLNGNVPLGAVLHVDASGSSQTAMAGSQQSILGRSKESKETGGSVTRVKSLEDNGSLRTFRTEPRKEEDVGM